MSVRLTNVIDTRTSQVHSVAIVKEKNVRWYVPADAPTVEEPELEEEETEE